MICLLSVLLIYDSFAYLNLTPLGSKSTIINILRLPSTNNIMQGYSSGKCVFYDSNYNLKTQYTCSPYALRRLQYFYSSDCYFLGGFYEASVDCVNDTTVIYSKKLNFITEYNETNATYSILGPYVKIFFPTGFLLECDLTSHSFVCDGIYTNNGTNSTNSTNDVNCTTNTNETNSTNITNSTNSTNETDSTCVKKSKITILQSSGISQSVRVIFNTFPSEFEIYCWQTMENITITFNKKVFIVTQQQQKIYLWMNGGIFRFNPCNNQTNLDLVFRPGFFPPSSRGLAVLNESIYYIDQEWVVRGVENQIQFGHFDSFRNFNDGFLARYKCLQSHLLIEKALNSSNMDIFPSQYNMSNCSNSSNSSNSSNCSQYLIINDLVECPIQIPNVTNITNITNITDVIDLTTYMCHQGCKLCYVNDTCIECETGYNLNDGRCEMGEAFAVATSVISYPYSSVAMKMVFIQFMEQFWYYEYHNHTYSSEVLQILETIGNMNRKRFIPIFVKDIVGMDLYNRYQQHKHYWGFSNSTNLTDQKYLRIEKEPLNFTVQASKMYIWNYAVSLAFFILNRFLALIFDRSAILRKPFFKTTVSSVVIMILIQGHVQYITFTFFRQIKNPSIHIFMDKVNLSIAILFMFIAFTYTICSYSIYSWFLGSKKFRILFPFKVKSKFKSMILVMFLGPGRSLLLGLFQSFYEDFVLQMCLLIILNFVSLMVLSMLKKTKMATYIVRFKMSFIILILIFLIAGLFHHKNLILSMQALDIIQFMCLCSLWTICVLDFCYGFAIFSVDLIYEFKQKCRSNRVQNYQTKTQTQHLQPSKKKSTRITKKNSQKVCIQNI